MVDARFCRGGDAGAFGEDSTVSWVGIFCGLGYAVSWALYILTSARVGRSISGLDGFAVATLLSALTLAPFGLSGASYFFETKELFFTAIFVAVFITIPFGLEFLALKRIPPRIFGVLLSLEPGIASIAGLLLLHGVLPLRSWIAILAVSAASAGVTLSRRR